MKVHVASTFKKATISSTRILSSSSIQRGNVSWLRILFVGLSKRRHGFNSIPVRVCFVVYVVSLGQVFLRVFRFTLSVSFNQRSIQIHSTITDVKQFQQLTASLNYTPKKYKQYKTTPSNLLDSKTVVK